MAGRWLVAVTTLVIAHTPVFAQVDCSGLTKVIQANDRHEGIKGKPKGSFELLSIRTFKSKWHLPGFKCHVEVGALKQVELVCAKRIANQKEREGLFKAFPYKECLPPTFTCQAGNLRNTVHCREKTYGRAVGWTMLLDSISLNVTFHYRPQ